MTTVSPPPPSPIPAPAAGPAATLIATNPPDTLLQLPAGSVIDAELLSIQAKGMARLQTAFGELEIRTKFPLPENAKLEIQLLRLTPQVLLAIKAVNGALLSGNSAPTSGLPGMGAQNALGGPAALAQAIGQALGKADGLGEGASSIDPQKGISTTIKMDIGSVIKATLLRSLGASGLSNSASNNVASPSPLMPGSTATPATGQTGLPAGQLAGQSGSVLTGSSQNATGMQPTEQKAPGQMVGGNAPRHLPTGAQFEMRMLAATNPSQGATASSGINTHNVAGGHSALTGTVVASTPAGQPIVFTSLGMIGLDTKSPLAPGANVRLEIISTSVKTSGSPLIHSTSSSIFQSREWPNLETALDEIAQTAPGVSQQVVSNSVPQANTQLTTNLLFFMSALKGGNVRSWIGADASGILDQKNPELLTRLSDEFSQLGRVFTENQPNDWRTALVPFFTGSGFEQVHMHMRGQKEPDGSGGEEETSRFIIDVELSQLGRIQLDGLVKSKGKKFDLIVRSDGPLPKEMRKDINQIFTDFTEVTGVTGGIVFQADKKFAEIELPHLEGGHNGVVV